MTRFGLRSEKYKPQCFSIFFIGVSPSNLPFHFSSKDVKQKRNDLIVVDPAVVLFEENDLLGLTDPCSDEACLIAVSGGNRLAHQQGFTERNGVLRMVSLNGTTRGSRDANLQFFGFRS